jgi:hypothetical protein
VLRDLSQQQLPIGFGKSRGLGRVTARYHRLTLAYPGRFGDNGYDFANHWYGVGAFPGLDADYGFQEDDRGGLPERLRGREMSDVEWGKPTLILGDNDRKRSFDQLDEAEAEAAHQEIEALLVEAVKAWADFVRRRREAKDG